MNDYRIIYTSQTGEISDGYITERTESSARKAFNAEHKGMNLTIQSVELHRENTCATKQQERDTLAAIRQMVEELGPQSYLGTAFEGCFEDAESNIENDFGCSQKQLADAAAEKVTELEAEVKRLKAQIKTAALRESDLSEAIKRVMADADQTITALRERVLAPDDLTDTIKLVTEKRIFLDTEVKNAAERIVEAAAEPESAAFQNAVKDHRAAKSDLDYYTDLLERLGRLAEVNEAA